MAAFGYQDEGAAFLSNGGVLLADQPGLGKSKQALDAAKKMGAETILVICPAIAVPVWKSEAAKWRPDLAAMTVREAMKNGKVPRRGRLLVASYDHLVANKALREKIGSIPHDLLVCDEAHAMKNPKAKRTMLIYGAGCAGGPNSLIGRVGATRILTGTPQLNHAGEWFPHLRALAPDRIEQRSFQAFVDHYCLKDVRSVRTKAGKTVNIETISGSNPETRKELAWRLKGFWLRRTVEQVMGDLPPLRVEVRRLPAEMLDADVLRKVEESDEAKTLWRAIASGDAEALRHLEGHLAKLRRLLALAKVGAAVEWARGALDAGEPKVALWGWHTEALRSVRAGLADAKPIYIDGSTSQKEREAQVRRFQEDPSCKAGVFQIQAAGTALTMTACRRVIMMEQAWTPASNFQAIKRCHRIGSTNAVLAEVLAAPGLDDAVLTILARKLDDIQAIEQGE